MKFTIKIRSLKALIRKIFRATIIIQVEVAAKKKPEVVDLTQEPDTTPMPMSSPAVIKARGVDVERDQRDVETAPSWTLTPETEGRGATPEPTLIGTEPSKQLATPKGKEIAYDQAQVMAQLSSPETPAGPSGVAETSSSPNIKKQEPTTPPRKRRLESPDIVVIKDEPEPEGYTFGGTIIIDSDSRPATPVKKEESSDTEDDDDDVIQISPFKKRRSISPDLSTIPVLPPFFERSPSPSLSSLNPNPNPNPNPISIPLLPNPLPTPFHHPSFPTRPALRCPNRIPSHKTLVTDTSRSVRNSGRWYFRCGECPGFGGFICWADNRGVHPDNPMCWCRVPAREDLTGDNSMQPDTLWYKCATDACRFRRFEWDDPLSPEEVNEYCGVAVYIL